MPHDALWAGIHLRTTTMTTTTATLRASGIRCRRRPLIFALAGIALVAGFWIAFRYPLLTGKAEHVGEAVPTMAYSSQVLEASATDSVGWRMSRKL